MRLSVNTKIGTISINNGNGVVVCLIVLLEERNGKNDVQFLGYLLEVSNESAGGSGLSKSERRLLLILQITQGTQFSYLAEIVSSEELLKKNDLSTLGSSLTDELFTLGDIFLPNTTKK
jgi:hypothetical protein